MRGFFERTMPKVGFILNTISSLATGAVDLVSIRIVSKSVGTSVAAGVIGTVSGTVLNWLIFLFSNVRADYAKIGRVIDQRLIPTDGLIEVNGENVITSSDTSYSIIFARLGLSGAVLTTSVLDAVSQYQEIQSLASSARNEGMNFSEDAAFWFGLCLATMNFTTEFLTYNSFANQAITALIIQNNSSRRIENVHEIVVTDEDNDIQGDGSQLNLGDYTRVHM